MATLTVTMTTEPGMIQDVFTYWLQKTTTSVPIATLSQAMTAQDTTAAFSGAPNLVVGNTIVIDNEPMAVTGVNPLVLSRGAFPLTTPTTHAVGAGVFLLMNPSPFSLFIQEALAPWVRSIVSQIAALGASQTMPVPTGQVTITL